jgi:hypothetical protein
MEEDCQACRADLQERRSGYCRRRLVGPRTTGPSIIKLRKMELAFVSAHLCRLTEVPLELLRWRPSVSSRFPQAAGSSATLRL